MRDLYARVCGCIAHNGFLTRKGYRALDGAVQKSDIDSMVSVSASIRSDQGELFHEEIIDEQYRRFLGVPGEGSI